MESKNRVIIIAYNKLSDNPADDEKDVIYQVNFIKKLLIDIGFNVKELPVTLNMEECLSFISSVKPYCVFNLVESLNGYELMLSCLPFLLDSLRIPYTGSNGASIAITTNKLMAKKMMKSVGIPTPQWWRIEEIKKTFNEFPIIVKPSTTHASQNIEDSSVIRDIKKWKEWLRNNPNCKDNFFIEKYIDGREFNLSLLEDPEKGVMVLPVAEIEFTSFPPDKPRIVGYAAKWKESSFEYQNTPRTFVDNSGNIGFIKKLKDIALRCWSLFSLSGYARVDFRVDENGNIFVLEVNANPCLSPDAGFIAASRKKGLSDEETIKKIVCSAIK